MHHIQQLAANILLRVESGTNLTEALAEAQRKAPDLSPSERGALQDLSYGACAIWRGCAFICANWWPSPCPSQCWSGC